MPTARMLLDILFLLTWLRRRQHAEIVKRWTETVTAKSVLIKTGS
jgi:hypothetical protein